MYANAVIGPFKYSNESFEIAIKLLWKVQNYSKEFSVTCRNIFAWKDDPIKYTINIIYV